MNLKTVFKLFSIRYPALRVTRAKIFAEKTNLFRIGTPLTFSDYSFRDCAAVAVPMAELQGFFGSME